jgi:RNA polymerase sigma factor (sigma-70 family)
MRSNTLGLFLRHLALSDEVSRLGSASDRDLLAAYESAQGQAAFTELMRRHGPMVLRTCRRVLGRGPDAEDAFQATFVLLARKAGRLRSEAAGPLSLGGWLHRVAYQTALNVLSQLSRRRARERQARAMTQPDPDPVTEATWSEVRPILDAELDALPDEARRLLIACYLQGKTHAAAAEELGLPLGSLARRLEKARALLAKRLARRGIKVSTALSAVLLGKLAQGAGVPAVLMVHTVEAAVTFTEQATGVVSDNVARLVQAGLTKTGQGSVRLGVALAGWLGLLGAGLVAYQTLSAEPDRLPEKQPPAARGAEGPGQEKPAPADRLGDPLPPGALARMGTVRLRSAAGGQRSLVFTKDGRGLITAGRGNPTRLWEVSSGKPVRQFGDQARYQAQAVSLSPDGRILAARGGAVGGLCLWDVATGKLLAEGKGGPADLARLAFSPEGKVVASAGNDNKLRLWDVATGREQWVTNSATGRVSAIAFSPDGKTLAALDEHGISSWDAATGKREPRRWNAERRLLLAAAFSSDGRTVAVACGPAPHAKGHESVVCLVDMATLKEVRQLAPEKGEQGTQEAFQSLAVAPDGKALATANGSGEVRLWDADTGKELRHCRGDRGYVDALAFSADGAMLAGVDGGLVRLWETASGKEVSPALDGHRRAVSSVAFLPDGRTLVSGSWDGSARVWDTATGEERQHILPGGDDDGDYELPGFAGVPASDGKTIATVQLAWPIKGESFGVIIRLWDRDAGRERSRHFQKIGNQLPQALALSPDGRAVACVPGTGAGSEVHLWDSATGKELSRVSGTSPAFSPDGKLLATVRGGKDGRGSFAVWEAATGKELCSVPMPEGHVYRLGFSPDARALVTASDVAGRANKNTIRLWPLLHDESGKSGSRLRVGSPRVLVEGLPYPVQALAFSPDGRTLALPEDGGTVQLLETATGKERVRFGGHIGQVQALSFSPDGRRLASGSLDTTILVWDVTGRLQGGHLRPAQLSAKERDELWADLAADDTGRAGRAVWALAADPALAVPLLAGQLRPVARLEPEAIAKLIRDLDDDAFAVRVKARGELARLGALAEPALRQTLEKAPSAEVERAVAELLDVAEAQRKNPSGDALRGVRAVEALEQIGSREARQVLKALAAGAPEAGLTQGARVALDRLERAEKR